MRKFIPLSALVVLSTLLAGCDSPPSDRESIELFKEHRALLKQLRQEGCSFLQDPDFKRLRIHANEIESSVTGKTSGYEEQFYSNDSVKERVDKVKGLLNALDAKYFLIMRGSGENYVTNSSCSLSIALTTFGMPADTVISGFAFNPKNEHTFNRLEELPKRKGQESLLYRFRLTEDEAEPWYFYFEKT
ncbi:hypothetical protein [Idiomarina ramblicola]|uniref:Lipoprotein n=1 Tax=Idiomarina ramblicola TaxID=263724 RepID=A0A432Z208_9GAMM|nr:hypothetical protein [Idiomarina ramblicola]RUO71863.1 hypothetical protein CWI78_04930 [Idiomarina ramblicola]